MGSYNSNLNFTMNKIVELLETKFRQYNHTDFIESDPISIPHRFSKKEDIEIAAFFAAILAWGQRPVIIRNSLKLMNWMENSPHEFILNHQPKDLIPFKTFKHRTFNGEDCLFFIETLQKIYSRYNSLENAFFPDKNIIVPENISNFKKLIFQDYQNIRTTKHIADPLKGSTAKRINMFFRWMVRKDGSGVDFGIWNKVSPADLYCPLDVHSGRVARKLGLLKRKQNDWRAVNELTANLRKLDPIDPVKYDFALFGLGIFEGF